MVRHCPKLCYYWRRAYHLLEKKGGQKVVRRWSEFLPDPAQSFATIGVEPYHLLHEKGGQKVVGLLKRKKHLNKRVF